MIQVFLCEICAKLMPMGYRTISVPAYLYVAYNKHINISTAAAPNFPSNIRIHSVGNYGILDGALLLFAAVVLFLKFRVGRSRNLTLCPVMNEFMYDSVATMLVRKSSESRDIGSRKHSCIPDCIAEYLRQGVNPLPALLLAHVKTSCMIALKRVVLQMDKYEKQPFSNRRKRAVGLDCVGTFSCDLFAFDIMPAEIFVMSLCKRQNLVKKGIC